MSNFLFVFFLALFYLIPLALIVLGILFRNESYGFALFMIGSVFISMFLIVFVVDFIADLICRILYTLGIDATFRDTTILSLPMLIACIFCSYKLFVIILTWKARKYIPIAKRFISQMQSAVFPSCEKIILNTLTDKIIHSSSVNTPKDLKKITEILVYNTALDLICSKRFHLPTTGALSPEGESLLYLCSMCLDSFLKNGYISTDKYDSECKFLKECKFHDFFNGPQPYF